MKYLGIDIGDGESAITVVSEDGAVIPSVISLGHVKNIRSVVGDLKGEPIIGDDSMLNAFVVNRSARFKSRFLTDTEAQNDVSRFAVGLYKLMRESVQDGKLNIALGCPADWPQEARERYATIVSNAGFSNIHTVSESRAAYLYAHYGKEMNLSKEDLAKPTLVIDIGSSTLDYAYIVDGKERNVGVFGENHLGGGILDELILNYAVSKSSDAKRISEIFIKYPSWKNFCELTARNVKENYFSHEEQYAEKECRDSAPIYASANEILSLTVGLNEASVNKLLDQPISELGEISFRAALRKSLESAKAKTAANPVEQIIMTGGASRMGFFRQMCAEVFSGANIMLCPEPEFSIARGLGIAARLDDTLNKFRMEVNAFFDIGIVREEVKNNLSSLLDDYVPLVCKVLRKKKWAEDIESCLIDPADQSALNTFLQGKVEELLNDDDSLIEKADELVNDWISKNMTKVQAGLDKLCEKYNIEKADMSLVKIHNSIKVDHIQVPSIVRFLYKERKSKWFKGLKKLLWNIKVGGVVKRALNSSIKEQLHDPHGEFAIGLGQEIRLQLLAQIDEQIDKVEFNI